MVGIPALAFNRGHTDKVDQAAVGIDLGDGEVKPDRVLTPDLWFLVAQNEVE